MRGDYNTMVIPPGKLRPRRKRVALITDLGARTGEAKNNRSTQSQTKHLRLSCGRGEGGVNKNLPQA